MTVHTAPSKRRWSALKVARQTLQLTAIAVTLGASVGAQLVLLHRKLPKK